MLTAAQLTALKADVIANVPALRIAKDVVGIAAHYNAVMPTGFVWRPDLGVDEVKAAVDAAEYGVLSQQARDLFAVLVTGTTINATMANTRTQFATIFSAANSVTLAALNALAKRLPTRLEALTSSSNVSPFYGYQLTLSDVTDAVFNPDGSLK